MDTSQMDNTNGKKINYKMMQAQLGTPQQPAYQIQQQPGRQTYYKPRFSNSPAMTPNPAAASIRSQGSWPSYVPRYATPVPAQSYTYQPQSQVYTASRGPAASPSTTSSTASNQGSLSSGSGEQLSKTNLYIRALHENTTDKDLVSLCSQFGTIISTKAILDKNTNTCKGYGFVDFESPASAEAAVKALQAKGIQAQMAKQQEQDPTNLYIANLPLYMTESDLESILAPYGTVVSTRILRNADIQSKGVGFARMESKEKCEQIISMFNGKLLTGCKDPLLVKFADGGNKKKTLYRNKEQQMWREPDIGQGISLSYDQSMSQNGIAPPLMTSVAGYQRYTPVNNYSLQPNATWMQPQYIVQPQMTPVIQSPVDPNALHYGSLIPQMTAQMNQLQLTASGSYMTGHAPAYTHTALYPQPAGPPMMQQLPIAEVNGKSVLLWTLACQDNMG